MVSGTVRTLVVLGTITALGAAVTPNAHAATGQFTYHTQPGNAARTLTDPMDDNCYPVGRNAQGQVVNNTDRRAILYVEKNCRLATVEELDPGQWVIDTTFQSVKFTP